MKEMNLFDSKELKESLNVWIEKTEGGEPALTNGKCWLMTWDARNFMGFDNLEKNGSKGDIFYEACHIGWMIENYLDKLKERCISYKRKGKTYDINSIESIKDFVYFYCSMESTYKTFIVPIIDSIALTCAKLKIIEPKQIIEFAESEIIREYFIKLIEYIVLREHSMFNQRLPYVIAEVMNRQFYNKIDYISYLKPIEQVRHL